MALAPLCAAAAAWAQTATDTRPPSAPAAAASAPAVIAPRPAAATPAPAAAAQQVEITGGRESDTEQRRRSTAAKIVIGREEIEKFGDATVGEVLRRLPGVTTPGAPGRGGPPRMRGLGGGFTQLLIDGQRVPPGFSLESLTPEQLERIEVLRAPTAETGARAIAGTINIITREGFRRRLNDLRLGLGVEDGEVSPGLFWTHNDSAGALTYNVSGGAFERRSRDRASTRTTEVDLGDGALVGLQDNASESFSQRRGLNLTSRLQWRLGEGGDSLLLNPSLFHSEGTSRRSDTLRQALPVAPSLYDRGQGGSDSRFTNARLHAQWRQRLTPATRLELNASGGAWRSRNVSEREEFRDGTTLPLRRTDDRSRTREDSANLTLKLSSLLGGRAEQPGSEHSLVGGLEAETVRRSEQRTALQDGVPLLTDFGDNLGARTLRIAGYLQDEWALTPQWALHAGLRWEQITTQGDGGDGTRPENRSRVATPLVHLLWKPDPKARDQVRLSLTRSYRSPATGALMARPWINGRYPVDGPNEPTAPDTAGNPGLQPELATGIDLAVERYLEGGGVLSANLFHRRISDVMRSVVSLETVSWSPVPRWVSRQQNIGDARTSGLELEAKFRLDQWLAEAPRVELRGNLALYRSRVEGIPGPDNRLAEQAGLTSNLGADYRLRSLPLTLGGNLNWVPGYRTQLAPDRFVEADDKRQLDVFALWTFSPAVGLRLLASNLAPADSTGVNAIDFARSGSTVRETATTTSPSFTNWQLRLELKL